MRLPLYMYRGQQEVPARVGDDRGSAGEGTGLTVCLTIIVECVYVTSTSYRMCFCLVYPQNPSEALCNTVEYHWLCLHYFRETFNPRYFYMFF